MKYASVSKLLDSGGKLIVGINLDEGFRPIAMLTIFHLDIVPDIRSSDGGEGSGEAFVLFNDRVSELEDVFQSLPLAQETFLI